ncbi:hypothetical protein MAR_030873, partial [Mya arenaria]
KTGIGKIVNTLKKKDGPVSHKAREIVDKWKEMVSAEKARMQEEEESYENEGYQSEAEVSANEHSDNENEARHSPNENSGYESDKHEVANENSAHNHNVSGDLASLLPSTQAHYRPYRYSDVQDRHHDSEGDGSQFLLQRNTRTQVYSGKKHNTVPAVYSLFDLCMKHFLEDSDYLWKRHCELKTTKMAFVDNVVKPPREVRRQQARFGTSNNMSRGKKHHFPGVDMISIGRAKQQMAERAQKKPMMQKTLHMVKNLKKR